MLTQILFLCYYFLGGFIVIISQITLRVKKTGEEVFQRGRELGHRAGTHVEEERQGAGTWGEGLTEWGLPLCSQQMPECGSQLANNRAGEAEGKRHSWGVRPSDRGAEGARAGPSWDTRGVRRGVGVADG